MELQVFQIIYLADDNANISIDESMEAKVNVYFFFNGNGITLLFMATFFLFNTKKCS